MGRGLEVGAVAFGAGVRDGSGWGEGNFKTGGAKIGVVRENC